jgi:hypothetical protein
VAEARDTSLAGLAVVQEGGERRDGARHVFAKVMLGELGPSRRGTISMGNSDGLSTSQVPVSQILTDGQFWGEGREFRRAPWTKRRSHRSGGSHTPFRLDASAT